METAHKGQLVLYVAYALIGFGTYLIARVFMAEEDSRVAQENLAESRDRKASNFLIKITRPFFSQYVVPKVRSRAFFDDKRRHYRRKITAAGLKEEITPDEF